ncbi:hypothetical protein, partial [Pseudidiomarina halophila]|uniref:hypothetical protein n=1 Tax=Pseudidiomarina halophila TaxID=1449799 RepID=UPI001A7E0FA9
ISQVYSLRYTKEYSHPKMLFLCLNPVSAHTVCLAWYIVKERSAWLKAGLRCSKQGGVFYSLGV